MFDKSLGNNYSVYHVFKANNKVNSSCKADNKFIQIIWENTVIFPYKVFWKIIKMLYISVHKDSSKSI